MRLEIGDTGDEACPFEERAVEGSVAFENLYRDRAEILVRHFTSRMRDRDEAVDVVHEAFARFASLSQRSRAAFVRPDSYLYRICINLFRDRQRHWASQERHRAEQAIVGESAHDPIHQLEARDTLHRLESAMLRLKPKTREIFLARRLDGMSYGEIAGRTGLSIKAIEKHMAKAVAQIDRLMERR